mmetsp:Transcript_1268/g.4276  ORF Transcript_1268/g.4276 Transcript_1268/m.4276 type:complete len:1206 (+) Transcript_1268:144-3761(+)|eukprot:CAMPEP_0118905258 /NCGR_PEP_ID=MMETSP1166-20130328/9356_1 /TAXON_ID=1104430 /ORGANISM="Chrysoreinhardia sp, Strain CCMP3193" /LENGTH=1205 /DNA_ID=CAMNT_0006844527 /DNA_START=39 /DNA_END=3656 /DNA_ORIENTATION=-
MAGGSSSKKKGHGPNHDLALTLTSVVTIACVLFLQVGARKLKRWSEGQKHASDVLEASERELMVLGLIAFLLFVLEQAAQSSQGEWVHIFHEVHFALFTVAIVYVGINASLYGLARRFGRRWEAYEEADIENHQGLVARTHKLRRRLKLRPLDRHLFFGSFWLRGVWRHPVAWFEYQRCLEHMTFHEIRRDFLRSQHLPHDFELTTYLESCMQHVCLEFTEIRDSVWVFGILGLVVHQFVSTLASEPEVRDVLVGLSVGIAVLVVVIFLKVKWIYWFVLHSEMLYSSGRMLDDDEEDDSSSSDDGESSSSPGGDSSSSSEGSSPTKKKKKKKTKDDSDSDDDDEPRREPSFGIQRSLFWFDNPGVVVTLLETCLFAMSGNVAIFVFNAEKLHSKGDLAVPLVALFAAAAALLLLLPRIVPRFTLITHIGEMTDPRRLAEAVTKQQQRGRLGYEKRHQSSRRSEKYSVLSSVYDTWRYDVVEAPGLSTLSAVGVVAYAFAVALTLDEKGARAVIGHGGVVVIRAVELGLAGCFLLESWSRLSYDRRDKGRQADATLVTGCAASDVASFAIFLATDAEGQLVATLHAISALVILRVVNTAWHGEVVEVRFDHIRLDLEKSLRGGAASEHHDTSRRRPSKGRRPSKSQSQSHAQARKKAGGHSHHHHAGGGGGHGPPEKSRRRATYVFGPKPEFEHTAVVVAPPSDENQRVAVSSTPSSVVLVEKRDDSPVAARRRSSDTLDLTVEELELTAVNRSRRTAAAALFPRRRPTVGASQPAWLAFYEPPRASVVKKSDHRSPSLIEAETRVKDLVGAAFASLGDAVDSEDSQTLALLALKFALAGADDDASSDLLSLPPHDEQREVAVGDDDKEERKDHAAENAENDDDDEKVVSFSHQKKEDDRSAATKHRAMTPRQQQKLVQQMLSPPLPPFKRITSTAVETLEDALYFNKVLLHAVATVAKDKRRTRRASFSPADIILRAHSHRDLHHHVGGPSSRSRSGSHSFLDSFRGGGHRGSSSSDAAPVTTKDHAAPTKDHAPSSKDNEEAALVWHRVKVVLTRDAVLCYRVGSAMSTIDVATGAVSHVAAEDADPQVVALEDKAVECHQPDVVLHLNTLLKIDNASPTDLVCTTTAHVVHVAFDDHTDAPRRWKAAIEDAIDREDDDDPLHPLANDVVATATLRRASKTEPNLQDTNRIRRPSDSDVCVIPS